MTLKIRDIIFIALLCCLSSVSLASSEDDNGKGKDRQEKPAKPEKTNLELLLDEKDPKKYKELLRNLVSQGLTLEDLKTEFSEGSLSEKDRKNFLRTRNKKFTKLTKDMDTTKKELIRENRKILTKSQREFWGDYTKAVNADENAINVYKNALARIETIIQQEKEEFILLAYQDCFDLISDLFHYHLHNFQIGEEAYNTGKTPTYQNLGRERAALHWNKQADAKPYEERAPMLFTTFERAFEFALANDMLSDLLIFLHKTFGCLEARMTKLNDWWQSASIVAGKRKSSSESPESSEKILESSAEETVYNYIMLHQPDYNVEGKDAVVARIVKEYKDCVDSEGNSVTASLVRHCLFETYLSPFKTPIHTPVTTPETRSRSGTPEKNSPSPGSNSKKIASKPRKTAVSKRLIFADEDELDAEAGIMASITHQVSQIHTIEFADGSTADNAQMVSTSATGSCGFEALGTDRETFIAEVLSAYLDPDLTLELRALIDQAIADLNLQYGDIHGWAEIFQRSGYWMQDIHFQIYSMMHHAPIQVYGVNSANTLFFYIQTFGEEETGTPILVINRSLLPTAADGDRPLNGNHFDGLVLTPTGAAAILTAAGIYLMVTGAQTTTTTTTTGNF